MKLSIDETFYKSNLQYEKDGVKANPIQLNDCNSADAETIGKHLIKLNAEWKPKTGENDLLQIGSLYGFALYIRREKQAYENKGMFEYQHHNVFYAESKESGLKYLWNNGYINTDNAKLAARYFLNAIDRVEQLKEKYRKNITELTQNIQMMEQIVVRPFQKSEELTQLKTEVASLEREISISIQKNQMKQTEGEHKPVEKNDAVVVELNTHKNGTSVKNENGKMIINKNEITQKKSRGLRI
jgi:hypothetical protein